MSQSEVNGRLPDCCYSVSFLHLFFCWGPVAEKGRLREVVVSGVASTVSKHEAKPAMVFPQGTRAVDRRVVCFFALPVIYPYDKLRFVAALLAAGKSRETTRSELWREGGARREEVSVC